MKSKKVGGVTLKLQIAESNLSAKNDELQRLKDKHADIVSERDFLRKIVGNLSDHRR